MIKDLLTTPQQIIVLIVIIFIIVFILLFTLHKRTVELKDAHEVIKHLNTKYWKLKNFKDKTGRK